MEPLLARAGEPLPTCVDMSVNDALKGVLERAEALTEHPYESASPAPVHHGRLEPLHLLAAVLEDETSAVAAVLHKTGVLREDVMRAMREGNSA
jgi:hypothetical protein